MTVQELMEFLVGVDPKTEIRRKDDFHKQIKVEQASEIMTGDQQHICEHYVIIE